MRRVFVGPIEIAGMYSQIARSLRNLGYQADFFERFPHPFSYGGEANPPLLLRLSRAFRTSESRKHSGLIPVFMRKVIAELFWSAFAISRIWRYDTFIFSYGQSLLHLNVDLPVLKLLGKKTIIHLGNGSEARPPYLDGTFGHLDCTLRESALKMRKLARTSQKRVRMAEEYASVIIGSPASTSAFATRPFVNSFFIGLPTGKLPFDENNSSVGAKDRNPEDQKAVRVLHAPSNRRTKGSDAIALAALNLGRNGVMLEYREISGVPNSEVKAALLETDLVVDQLFSDTPLAGLASEAATLGIPTIVGGESWHEISKYWPMDMGSVSYLCKPEEIQNALQVLIESRALRKEIGAAARQYVLNYLEGDSVARRFGSLIEDRIPKDWFVNPKDVHIISGVGQSNSVSRNQIKGLVKHFGKASLALSHNKALLNAVLQYAEIESS